MNVNNNVNKHEDNHIVLDRTLLIDETCAIIDCNNEPVVSTTTSTSLQDVSKASFEHDNIINNDDDIATNIVRKNSNNKNTNNNKRTRQYKPKYRATKRPQSERKFPCQQCESRFFTQKDVKRHMVVHTGVRNFACPFCQQRFGRKDHLVRHAKKSHDQDTRSIKRRNRILAATTIGSATATTTMTSSASSSNDSTKKTSSNKKSNNNTRKTQKMMQQHPNESLDIGFEPHALSENTNFPTASTIATSSSNPNNVYFNRDSTTSFETYNNDNQNDNSRSVFPQNSTSITCALTLTTTTSTANKSEHEQQQQPTASLVDENVDFSPHHYNINRNYSANFDNYPYPNYPSFNIVGSATNASGFNQLNEQPQQQQQLDFSAPSSSSSSSTSFLGNHHHHYKPPPTASLALQSTNVDDISCCLPLPPISGGGPCDSSNASHHLLPSHQHPHHLSNVPFKTSFSTNNFNRSMEIGFNHPIVLNEFQSTSSLDPIHATTTTTVTMNEMNSRLRYHHNSFNN